MKFIYTLLLLAILLGCNENPFKKKTAVKKTPSGAQPVPAPTENLEEKETPLGNDEDKINPEAEPTNENILVDDEVTPDKKSKEEKEGFFFNEIVPWMNQSKEPDCSSCHNKDKVQGPGLKGPAEIYEEEHMRELLSDGEYANENALVTKMMDDTLHAGGRICESVTEGFCKLLMDWWQGEFGDGVGDISYGEILTVSTTGLVSGFASDIRDDDRVLMVRIYYIDENGESELVGEGEANEDVVFENDFYPKGFNIQLPSEVIDGLEHQVRATVVEEGDKESPVGDIFTYTAFKPRGEGVVAGFGGLGLGINGMSRCAGCHNGFEYEDLWKSLSFPKPFDGGTPTNNALYWIMTPGNPRSAGHSGGVVGNAASAITWWCDEFDPNRQSACSDL